MAVAAAAFTLAIGDDDVALRDGTFTARHVLLPAWERGMNLTAYQHDALEQPEAQAALTGLVARTGTTHAVVVPTWYMATRDDTRIEPDAAKTVSDAGVVATLRAARAKGLVPILKPHVDVLDGTFRGEIAPADPAAWFASYRRMVGHYARLAQEGGATTLVVGDELVTMARRTEEMRAAIAVARGAFRGRLTYAANWVQEAERVEFWDALDIIGVDAYMPLETATADPSVAELVAAWRPWRERLDRLRRRHRKPVLFTELGYADRAATTRRPSSAGDGPLDQAAQARAYEAALTAFGTVPWFRGIWWWDWALDDRADTPESGDYSPRGKRAERVLQAWSG